MKSKIILTCILLSGSLAITSPLLADEKDNNQIEKMQRHWEELTSEKDLEKRKIMIEEHKTMMDKIKKSSEGHHMNHMSGHHMNNIMDMHHSMIHMME